MSAKQVISFKPGDTIKVHQKIQEGDKTRIQIFEGIVLGLKGRGENRSVTVQKMVGDISVQRIWPLNSPLVHKIEFVHGPKKPANRAKLNHLKLKK